eukprot:s1211_g6.t1
MIYQNLSLFKLFLIFLDCPTLIGSKHPVSSDLVASALFAFLSAGTSPVIATAESKLHTKREDPKISRIYRPLDRGAGTSPLIFRGPGMAHPPAVMGPCLLLGTGLIAVAAVQRV